MTNGTGFLEFTCTKVDILATYASIFGYFSSEISVYLIFLSEFLDFSVEWFTAAAGNSTICAHISPFRNYFLFLLHFN